MLRRSLLITVVSVGVAVTGTLRPASAGGSEGSGLERLAWLAGSWSGVADGVEMEEYWTVPRAGVMLGLHRDSTAGRLILFEFLRIEETTEGIVYLASPRGRPGTPFKLAELGEKRVVFENPEHDFPQRIAYWRGEDGSLRARIEGLQDGRRVTQEWRWQRAGDN